MPAVILFVIIIFSIFNYVSLRALIRELSAETGVSHMGYRPYSFRRGGASWDFRKHGSLDRAFQRGRWVSLSAAKLYITEAYATVGTLALPDKILNVYPDAKCKLGVFGFGGKSDLF